MELRWGGSATNEATRSSYYKAGPKGLGKDKGLIIFT